MSGGIDPHVAVWRVPESASHLNQVQVNCFFDGIFQIRKGITSKHLFGLEDLFYKYGKEETGDQCDSFCARKQPKPKL